MTWLLAIRMRSPGFVRVCRRGRFSAGAVTTEGSFFETIFGCLAGASALLGATGVGGVAAAARLAGVAGLAGMAGVMALGVGVDVGVDVEVAGCAASEPMRANVAARASNRPGVVGGCFMGGGAWRELRLD